MEWLENWTSDGPGSHAEMPRSIGEQRMGSITQTAQQFGSTDSTTHEGTLPVEGQRTGARSRRPTHKSSEAAESESKPTTASESDGEQSDASDWEKPVPTKKRRNALARSVSNKKGHERYVI
jgi:hypothetical protein